MSWWSNRRLRDCVGMELKTVRVLGSGNQVIPAGTKVRLRHAFRWNDLHIDAAACPHCGIQVRMNGVSRFDLGLPE